MKCYAYDKEANICLIYGCDCDFEKWCFHTSKQEAIKIGIIKDTEMNNHDTKKKQLLDLIEELKGKGVSANVSAQVAVSFMNGYTLIDKEE